jgi:hypothetical protein
MLAPFGARFPGLAPAITRDIDSELLQRALHQYTPDARIGLVPAERPADILPGYSGSGSTRSGCSSPGHR